MEAMWRYALVAIVALGLIGVGIAAFARCCQPRSELHSLASPGASNGRHFLGGEDPANRRAHPSA